MSTTLIVLKVPVVVSRRRLMKNGLCRAIQASLAFDFIPQQKQAFQTKTLTVRGNSETTATYLTIRATIIEPAMFDTMATSSLKPPFARLCVPNEEQVAVIEFDNAVVDFGNVKQGDTLTHEFTFRNVGTAPYKITNAKAFSRGLTLLFPKAAIEPGEKGSIQVQFDTTDAQGLQTKNFILQGNSDSTPLRLTVKANVQQQSNRSGIKFSGKKKQNSE